jgi:hypothetical protein
MTLFLFLGLIGHGQIYNCKSHLGDDSESLVAGTNSFSITNYISSEIVVRQ